MKNNSRAFSFPLKALLLLLLTGIFSSCEKNVDTLILFTDISLSSYVFNSSTLEPITEAEIIVNGTSATQSSTDGKFTLKNLKEGSYTIQVKKSGYSADFYTLTVKNYEGFMPSFYLRPLAPPVSIDEQGGIVNAYYTTGKLAAELIIPPASFDGTKQISTTVLFGNEVPEPIIGDNEIQGTVVSFNSDDEINFANGADLTFTLPYLHRPGDLIEVTLFNEELLKWETFEYIPVNEDGLSTSVTIYHFSLYSIIIKGSCTTTSVSGGNYLIRDNNPEGYNWTSDLYYDDPIPGEDETSVTEIKLYLNQLIEAYSGLTFTQFNYVELPTETFEDVFMTAILSPEDPPVGNPIDYASYPVNEWEVLQQCCTIEVEVTLEIYNAEIENYEQVKVIAYYSDCHFTWLWRANDSYSIEPYLTCSGERIIIPASDITHSGGSTN